METMLKLWCDNQGNVKCVVYSQAKQIFERLKNDTGEMAKELKDKSKVGLPAIWKSN